MQWSLSLSILAVFHFHVPRGAQKEEHVFATKYCTCFRVTTNIRLRICGAAAWAAEICACLMWRCVSFGSRVPLHFQTLVRDVCGVETLDDLDDHPC